MMLREHPIVCAVHTPPGFRVHCLQTQCAAAPNHGQQVGAHTGTRLSLACDACRASMVAEGLASPPPNFLELLDKTSTTAMSLHWSLLETALAPAFPFQGKPAVDCLCWLCRVCQPKIKKKPATGMDFALFRERCERAADAHNRRRVSERKGELSGIYPLVFKRRVPARRGALLSCGGQTRAASRSFQYTTDFAAVRDILSTAPGNPNPEDLAGVVERLRALMSNYPFPGSKPHEFDGQGTQTPLEHLRRVLLQVIAKHRGDAATVTIRSEGTDLASGDHQVADSAPRSGRGRPRGQGGGGHRASNLGTVQRSRKRSASDLGATEASVSQGRGRRPTGSRGTSRLRPEETSEVQMPRSARIAARAAAAAGHRQGAARTPPPPPQQQRARVAPAPALAQPQAPLAAAEQDLLVPFHPPDLEDPTLLLLSSWEDAGLAVREGPSHRSVLERPKPLISCAPPLVAGVRHASRDIHGGQRGDLPGGRQVAASVALAHGGRGTSD